MTLKNPWPGSPPLPPLGETYGRRPRGQRDFHNFKVGLVVVFIVGGFLYLRAHQQTRLAGTTITPRFNPIMPSSGSPTPGPVPATAHGLQLVTAPTFAGQQPGDVVATADGRAQIGGLAITTAGWSRSVGGTTPVICGRVTMTNLTAGPVDYNGLMQWRLQSPSGDSRMSTFGGGGELMGGTVIAGGTATGRLCFDDPGLHGRYVGLYASAPFGPGPRAAWLIDG